MPPLQFVARPIQHPLFKNLSMADAAAQLQEPGVPVGQAIVRPSTRGAKGLWLTMKLPDGIWHLYIEEQGKVRYRGTVVHRGWYCLAVALGCGAAWWQ